MSQRRWPTFWEWVSIYIRLSLGSAPTLRKARETAGLTDELWLSVRRKTDVRWVKPLQKFYEMPPLPEFVIQFLDAMERWNAPSPQSPRPEISSPGASQQTYQINGEPLPAPPQNFVRS